MLWKHVIYCMWWGCQHCPYNPSRKRQIQRESEILLFTIGKRWWLIVAWFYDSLSEYFSWRNKGHHRVKCVSFVSRDWLFGPKIGPALENIDVRRVLVHGLSGWRPSRRIIPMLQVGKTWPEVSWKNFQCFAKKQFLEDQKQIAQHLQENVRPKDNKSKFATIL